MEDEAKVNIVGIITIGICSVFLMFMITMCGREMNEQVVIRACIEEDNPVTQCMSIFDEVVDKE
jgi:predicted metal-binding protein